MAPLNNTYIIKLLTLLVKRNKAPIRVPAKELMDSDVGQGIRVWWDDTTTELVIDHMPRGATVYSIGDNQTWLANQLPQEPLSIPKPKSTEDLIAKVWTESAGSPTNQELANQSRQHKSRVIHVDDESIVSAETEQRKRELMKEIESYQSPQPAVTPSGNRTTFYKQ